MRETPSPPSTLVIRDVINAITSVDRSSTAVSSPPHTTYSDTTVSHNMFGGVQGMVVGPNARCRSLSSQQRVDERGVERFCSSARAQNPPCVHTDRHWAALRCTWVRGHPAGPGGGPGPPPWAPWRAVRSRRSPPWWVDPPLASMSLRFPPLFFHCRCFAPNPTLLERIDTESCALRAQETHRFSLGAFHLARCRTARIAVHTQRSHNTSHDSAPR